MATVAFQPLDAPLRTLSIAFICWKAVLLLIAACSPGPGYDTSTNLLLSSLEYQGINLPSTARYLISKLVRWDGIYYVQLSERGYLYEQEWAFGWGFTRIIHFITIALSLLGTPKYEGLEALVGVLVAHTAHLLSTFCLYRLSLNLFISKRYALTSALLYIISPAGIFLSAPFAESSCALFTFAGIYCFTNSFGAENGNNTFGHDILVLLSGISFGIATTVRSNGLFSGLLLLEEAFRVLFSIRDGLHLAKIRRLIITGLGGMCAGAGFLLPQYLAYQEYCGGAGHESTRSWCTNMFPSIYTFVQEYYWNCGLWRYWTFSNVPLFLLAAPMIAIMFTSGFWALRANALDNGSKQTVGDPVRLQNPQVFRTLAISQLLLTTITLTSAHVQIITRISSSYPVWIWYLAASVAGAGADGLALSNVSDIIPKGLTLATVGRFMVMYAVIQGGLFSSFLPPA
ncbi:GPI mannosyltransferase 2 protein [Rutstroemia sp. NJR-2017a WRK4]|nr:GPI mannosyltransferase 2 protein [Rutstroemia sp. NJR-2017a WRK4]